MQFSTSNGGGAQEAHRMYYLSLLVIWGYEAFHCSRGNTAFYVTLVGLTSF